MVVVAASAAVVNQFGLIACREVELEFRCYGKV